MKAKQTRIFWAKNQVDSLSQDKASKLGLRIMFVGLGLAFLILGVAWSKLPPEVPLLYSRPYGELRLINQWGLWLLPGLSLGLNLISLRLAGKVMEKDKLLAQILIWSGTIVTMMALVGLVKIIFLVT